MLVYPVLVVTLGALWPLDWTPIRLDSLSPVTDHYRSTAWAMAEKVNGGDDPEEVVVVEGTTSDEVGKNKESQKGWKQKLREWAIEYGILDTNGNFQWDLSAVVAMLLFIMATMTGGVPAAVVVILLYFLGKKFYMFMKDNCCGGGTKNLRAKTVD